MDKLYIEMHETPNYLSLIEITPDNINYKQLLKVDEVLNRANRDWMWLYAQTNLQKSTFKSYLAGREHLSLNTVVEIATVLRDYISNPKELMDAEKPCLKFYGNFKLNVREIKQKYNITDTDLVFGTGIDRGTVSRIVHGKTTQLRADRLKIIHDYFVERGVPLENPIDLVYFEDWNESPLHFLKQPTEVKGLIFKFFSKLNANRLTQNGLI